MCKLDIVPRLYLLGERVLDLSGELADNGYSIPFYYQSLLLQLEKKIGNEKLLADFWKEKAKEYLALEGSKYTISNALYPEEPLYKSNLINRLRNQYSTINKYPNPVPTYIYLNSNTPETLKTKNEIQDAVLNRREAELALIKENGYIPEYPDIEKNSKLIYSIFEDVFFANPSFIYKVESSKKSPIACLKVSNSWYLSCCLSYDYNRMLYPPSISLFLIKNIKNIDLWGKSIDNEDIIEIRVADICPGFEFYSWRCNNLIDFILAIRANCELFLKVAKNTESLLAHVGQTA